MCFADDIAHGSFYMQMLHLIILFFERHQWKQGIKAHTRHVLLYKCRPNTWSNSQMINRNTAASSSDSAPAARSEQRATRRASKAPAERQ